MDTQRFEGASPEQQAADLVGRAEGRRRIGEANQLGLDERFDPVSAAEARQRYEAELESDYDAANYGFDEDGEDYGEDEFEVEVAPGVWLPESQVEAAEARHADLVDRFGESGASTLLAFEAEHELTPMQAEAMNQELEVYAQNYSGLRISPEFLNSLAARHGVNRAAPEGEFETEAEFKSSLVQGEAAERRLRELLDPGSTAFEQGGVFES